MSWTLSCLDASFWKMPQVTEMLYSQWLCDFYQLSYLKNDQSNRKFSANFVAVTLVVLKTPYREMSAFVGLMWSVRKDQFAECASIMFQVFFVFFSTRYQRDVLNEVWYLSLASSDNRAQCFHTASRRNTDMICEFMLN